MEPIKNQDGIGKIAELHKAIRKVKAPIRQLLSALERGYFVIDMSRHFLLTTLSLSEFVLSS